MYFMYLTVEFYQVSRAEKPADAPEMVSVFDFRWALISATVLHFFKRQVSKVVEPIIRPICKNQNDVALLKVRSHKAALQIYKCFYMIATSIWGYLVFKDTEVYPYLLGGTNVSGESYYINSPYNRAVDGALMYAMITYGYHLEELVDLVCFLEPSNDYYEMLLHHLAAVILYLGMVGNNSINAAGMCGWFHGLADIFVYLSRVFSQTEYAKYGYFAFALLIVSWFWTRLVVI